MRGRAYSFDMGRQLSHLLGAIGMLLSMVLWLSLLNPSRADHFVDSVAGPQHEYKIVLGAALLATVFAFVAAVSVRLCHERFDVYVVFVEIGRASCRERV